MQTLQITGEEFARLTKRLLDTAREADSYARVVMTAEGGGIKLTVGNGDPSVQCARMVEEEFADKNTDYDEKSKWRGACSTRLDYGRLVFSITVRLGKEVSDEAE